MRTSIIVPPQQLASPSMPLASEMQKEMQPVDHSSDNHRHTVRDWIRQYFHVEVVRVDVSL